MIDSFLILKHKEVDDLMKFIIFLEIWPQDQTHSTMTRIQVKRSPASKRGLPKTLPEESSGSGENSETAEGSGINMLKDFMISENKAKGPKGDSGYKHRNAEKAKINNMRKHDNLLHEMMGVDNSESQPENNPKNTRLKGDNGKVLSHSEKKWLHSFFGHDVLHGDKNTEINTNAGVLDKLNHIEEERKQILTNFHASQREESSGSGNYEQSSLGETKTKNTAKNEKVPSQVYEKHRQLYEELSQFFPNGNHQSLASETSSLRAKRHRIEEFDDVGYDLNPDVDYDDDDVDEEASDEETDYDDLGQESLAREIAANEADEEYGGMSRSRRSSEDIVDKGFKRKVSPDPAKNYDDYDKEATSPRPMEVPYENQKIALSYQEPTSNNLEKISSEKSFEDQSNLADPAYERKKSKYLEIELGSGLPVGRSDYSGLESGESGNFRAPIKSSYLQGNSAKGVSFKAAQKSVSAKIKGENSRLDTAKINMKGPKIGTDPGRPIEAEKYVEEEKQQVHKHMHKKKKGKKKYQKKDKEGVKERTEWRNNGHKNVKEVADLGGKGNQEIGHVKHEHGKEVKGLKSKTGEFSEQLGRIGKAKSRRKRIKLVMEKRKRKAERSLNGETWGSNKKVSMLCHYVH